MSNLNKTLGTIISICTAAGMLWAGFTVVANADKESEKANIKADQALGEVEETKEDVRENRDELKYLRDIVIEQRSLNVQQAEFNKILLGIEKERKSQ